MTLIGDKLYVNVGTSNAEIYTYYPQELTTNTPPPTTWETEPPLPAGMMVSQAGRLAVRQAFMRATKPIRFTLTKVAILLPTTCTSALTMLTHTL